MSRNENPELSRRRKNKRRRRRRRRSPRKGEAGGENLFICQYKSHETPHRAFLPCPLPRRSGLATLMRLTALLPGARYSAREIKKERDSKRERGGDRRGRERERERKGEIGM